MQRDDRRLDLAKGLQGTRAAIGAPFRFISLHRSPVAPIPLGLNPLATMEIGGFRSIRSEADFASSGREDVVICPFWQSSRQVLRAGLSFAEQPRRAERQRAKQHDVHEEARHPFPYFFAACFITPTTSSGIRLAEFRRCSWIDRAREMERPQLGNRRVSQLAKSEACSA